MRKHNVLLLFLGLMSIAARAQTSAIPYHLVIVAPEHFHAALLQRSSYPLVDPVVHVYAPAEGVGLQSYLGLVGGYNHRPDHPTAWKEEVYTGADYFEKMLRDKPGNVVVLAGNNRLKADYILKSISAGLNVFADKPMIISEKEFPALLNAFTIAKKKGVLLYDIMTERYQATNWLLRYLMQQPALFGELTTGSAEAPAVEIESVHHFLKTVSGKPLLRPAWYFDVRQQGEGIVDVSTHFVDLAQWQCFPDQRIDYRKDIRMEAAKRWPTAITPAGFSAVTGLSGYPGFLQKDLVDSQLQVYANGEMEYLLKGIHVKIRVIWNFQAPAGGGDTQFEKVVGTKATLIIREGAEQQYIPELYIEPRVRDEAYERSLNTVIDHLDTSYPGVGMERTEKGWKLVIPETYRLSHEATFAKVAATYFRYLQDGQMPQWEIDGMLAKYYTTTSALKLALAHQ